MREGWKGEFSVALDDLFMSHVACNALKHFLPTHVVVLGDLISYQRLDDAEFARRAKRYAAMFDFNKCLPAGFQHPIFINVTGNHDIGYGAEFTRAMVNRFEQYYGPVNDVFFIEGHALVVVNAMNVDPAADRFMREQTLQHIRKIAEQVAHEKLRVILLEHIPLAKPDGACVDPWLYRTTKEGFVLEQNHLSHEGTARLLDSLKPVLVFNGHDHEGCFYQHNNSAHTQEYTVRSMMGDFGGNSLVLDIDNLNGEYVYRVTSCAFVPIKALWAIVLLLISWFVALLLWICSSSRSKL